MSVRAKSQVLIGGAEPRVTRKRWSQRQKVRLVLGLVLLGAGATWAWLYGMPETWIEISRARQLTMGASQQITVALQYRPPFLTRGQVRPTAGTIQLISFGEGVEVTPTTLVTTAAAPAAVFTVTGRRAGVETLIFAGSDTPKDPRSWRTMSTNVSVVPNVQVGSK